jgi:hypothetical protein
MLEDNCCKRNELFLLVDGVLFANLRYAVGVGGIIFGTYLYWS